MDHALKVWLAQEGRKVVWLAAQLGVHPTLLPQWVAGTRAIPLAQAERIAELTGGKVAVESWSSCDRTRATQ